jgi:cytidine deaminase
MLAFDKEALVREACEVRKKSYSPYSKFAVGAALLAKSGEIFTGTNVENISFGMTICAERVACFKAISEGVRGFVAVAIVTSNSVFPCGACRQVMSEFAVEHVIIANQSGEITDETHLEELLPKTFEFLKT